jgi:23S rRNA (uracil1939-C5)-methyltransferase
VSAGSAVTGPVPRQGEPHEDVVQCEHGERCGGCSLLGVPEAEQLRRKHANVQAALARYPRLRALTVSDVVPARPNVAYRTRAKLVVATDGRVGLYARGGHDVVDIPHCRVLATELAQGVAAVRALARRERGVLSGTDVREVRDGGATGLLVTLIGEPRARVRLESLARELGDELPCALGVAVSERPADAPALLAGTPAVITGAPAARDRASDGEPYVLATHGSFVQSHRGQAAAIAARVQDGLRSALGTLEGARVLELYAGSGALGLALSKRGAELLLVERYAPALALAEQAAREQGLAAPRTLAGDAARAATELAHAAERFAAVVVNPPRAGLAKEVRGTVAQLAPRVIAYVSCDPETLARDLDQLVLLGYAPRAVEPFDMIPLSEGVECVALLEPATPPPIAVLHEDGDLLAAVKPPHMPTTPQQGGGPSLLARLRAERGLPELTPVHRLDIGTSGVCLLAKRRSAVAALSRALAQGEKQYLALARGVTRDKGAIARPLREQGVEKAARTRYARLEVLGGHSLVRVRPDEGRTHQIRKHLAAIGHPLLGDARYGHAASNRHVEQRHGLDRTFLHLARVDLVSPRGPRLVLEAELAGDLQAVAERMRGTNRR